MLTEDAKRLKTKTEYKPKKLKESLEEMKVAHLRKYAKDMNLGLKFSPSTTKEEMIVAIIDKMREIDAEDNG